MRRLLVLCCAIVLIDTVFFGALTPLLPYFTREFELSRLAVGTLNGAYGLGIVVGALPGAILAARLGVRTTAIIGLVILAVTSVLFALSGSIEGLIALRFGAGFGSACSWIGAFTWVVSAAAASRRGQMIGTLVSSAVVGAMVGPALGSVAASAGLLLVFGVIALVSLAVAIGVSVQPAPTHLQRWSYADLPTVLRPRTLAGLGLIALAPLLFSTLITLAPLRLSALGWGTSAIGGMFLLGAALEASGHPLMGRWADHAGVQRPLMVSLGVSTLALLLLPLIGGAWLLAIFVAFCCCLFNLALTPATVLFSHSLDQLGGSQILGFALTNVAWAGGFAAGAPLSGLLADLGGDTLAYVPLALGCGLALLGLRRVLAATD